MSQYSLVINNEPGYSFRSDVNNAHQTLVTLNSGGTEPSTKYPFMLWADSANSLLKQRNSTNTAWKTIGTLDIDAWGLNSVVYGSAPSSPLPFQFWVDTSGASPIIKYRNAANTAWITLGLADQINWGLLSLSGGTMSGPLVFSNTDYMGVPKGTTAQRPGSPVSGIIRFNTDTVSWEGHNGTSWVPIGGSGYTQASQSVTSGGNISYSTTESRQLILVSGNAGPQSTSTTPFGYPLTTMKDRTEFLIVGTDDTNTVTIPFNDANGGALLNGDVILKRGQVQKLIWINSLSRFIDGGRNF